ncbi:MAG: peptide-methionine (R)-S-oxide reductase [Flavobacteriales bacterium]|nr:peptide-methionine (R)-S-oxide reductase [Flavobacteriales bacterium]|tara:strand:+ start:64 stop:501 length:438 start_codon:yes stop_codon:yes gene_type:complete
MRIICVILICVPFISFSQYKVKSNNYFENLTSEEKRIIVNKGTERAGIGIYVNHFEKGVYICKACNNPLYKSDSKFKSNCGWPSFDDEIKDAVIRSPDYSFGMQRIEICCSNCKGHLGHVFEGEKLTEKNIRHCVNSLSIKFVKY